LSKQQLVLKVGKLTKHNKKLKQEVTEYQVLDRHIKSENAQLKEYITEDYRMSKKNPLLSLTKFCV
jgi:hypothetical protein